MNMDNKYSKLKAAYEASTPQMPDDFTDKVIQRVTPRRRSPLTIWFTSVAAVAVVLIVVGVLLWPRQETMVSQQMAQTDVAIEDTATEQKATATLQPTIEELPVTTTPAPRKVQTARVTPMRSMTPIDSLADIVARLEVEMQGISDSCYLANVEKLIKADDQLQKLVNNLILDGILTDTITRVAIIDNP